MRALVFLAGLLCAAAFAHGAEPVDNCASLLGSLSVELRIARKLPAGQPTTFKCPREWQSRAALGASQQRVRGALGAPDRNESAADGGQRWVYRFASRYGAPDAAVPELAFRFDAAHTVLAVDCTRKR